MTVTQATQASSAQTIAWHSPRFAGLLAALTAARTPIYVVGGAVRDHLLGRTASTADLDLTFASPVLPVARKVADQLGWAYYPLDEERDVARLIGSGPDGQRLECDMAALRGDLESDLTARDFTANALALEITRDAPPQLIDTCGGAADIQNRVLRQVTAQSLVSDPARLLRAVRLAQQLDFTIETETWSQISRTAGSVLDASRERLRDELWKLLACPGPDAGMAELQAVGLLPFLLPEVAAMQGVQQSPPHHLDVYEHTRLTMSYAAELRDWLRGGPVPQDQDLAQCLMPWQENLVTHFAEDVAVGHDRAGWLVWHALFHDTGKPESRTVEILNGQERVRFLGHEDRSAEIAGSRTAALQFSRREAQLAERVATFHMRPHHLNESFPSGNVSRRAAFRFFRDTASGATGPRTGLDVILQAIADRQATGLERGEPFRRFLHVMTSLLSFTFSQPQARQKPLIDGRDVMTYLKLSPGRLVGSLLNEIAEAQAAGEITSQEEALDLAQRLYAETFAGKETLEASEQEQVASK